MERINVVGQHVHCPAKVWTHLKKSFFCCIYRFNYRSQTVLYNVFVQNNIVLITFERFLLIIIYLLYQSMFISKYWKIDNIKIHHFELLQHFFYLESIFAQCIDTSKFAPMTSNPIWDFRNWWKECPEFVGQSSNRNANILMKNGWIDFLNFFQKKTQEYHK